MNREFRLLNLNHPHSPLSVSTATFSKKPGHFDSNLSRKCAYTQSHLAVAIATLTNYKLYTYSTYFPHLITRAQPPIGEENFLLYGIIDVRVRCKSHSSQMVFVVRRQGGVSVGAHYQYFFLGWTGGGGHVKAIVSPPPAPQGGKRGIRGIQRFSIFCG